jgi:cell division protein FtsN
MEAEERDITIGPGKLLGLFFMLATICGVFFGIGYSLGKTSAHEQALNDKAPLSASLTAPAVGDASAPKPSAAVPSKPEPETAAAAEQENAPKGPDLTFFDAVKRKDGPPEAAADVSKASGTKVEAQRTADATATKAASAVVPALPSTPEVAPPAKADSKATMGAPASGAFVVQVAAVTREEDAAALAGALRKKSYSVFVVNNPAVHDKFYHVQVGPFVTLQGAEEMKAKLIGEGYNPIVKKS